MYRNKNKKGEKTGNSKFSRKCTYILANTKDKYNPKQKNY